MSRENGQPRKANIVRWLATYIINGDGLELVVRSNEPELRHLTQTT
ncbi:MULTISPECIES: hypothetical protein [Acetobacterales]|nr:MULTISPECIES: hypothetical protein [Acetobacteraceae]